jgi:hypothetical protein
MLESILVLNIIYVHSLTHPNMLDVLAAGGALSKDEEPKSFPPPEGIVAEEEAPAEGPLIDFPAGLATVATGGVARGAEAAGGNCEGPGGLCIF